MVEVQFAEGRQLEGCPERKFGGLVCVEWLDAAQDEQVEQLATLWWEIGEYEKLLSSAWVERMDEWVYWVQGTSQKALLLERKV
jgi:hypothetical protein